MRLKAFTLLLISAIPSSLFAQAKITLTFDSDAPKIVFSSPGWPTGLPTVSELRQAKEIEFPLGTVTPTDNIVVWMRDSNNAAIRTVKDLKDAWAVHPEDYRFVGLVKIRVEHEGKPVAAASVDLEDKSRKQSQVLDPSSKGELKFFGVTPGEFKVTVNYRSLGKASSSKQGFEVALKRDTVEPTFVISIPQNVDTVGLLTSKTGEETKKPEAVQAPAKAEHGFRDWLIYLVLLLLAAGALYGGLVYLKKNQKAVANKLKTFGVEMPEPPPAPPLSAPQAQPSPPQPLQKIMLDDAAPTPIGVTQAAPAHGPAEPRLVLESGQIVKLSDGENLVGRDAGLSVSLVGESTVSRKHASLSLAGQTVTARDLGSTNGTYVNGQKLDDERVLKTGDSVQFGQVRARFEA